MCGVWCCRDQSLCLRLLLELWFRLPYLFPMYFHSFSTSFRTTFLRSRYFGTYPSRRSLSQFSMALLDCSIPQVWYRSASRVSATFRFSCYSKYPTTSWATTTLFTAARAVPFGYFRVEFHTQSKHKLNNGQQFIVTIFRGFRRPTALAQISIRSP